MNRMRETPPESKRSAKASGPMRLPKSFISLLSGNFLKRERMVGNMPFILYLVGLSVVCIAYGYHAERVVRDMDATAAALKEQRAEYISVRAELEKLEQQSQVAGRIGALGLKESRVPPVKVKVDEDQLEDTRNP